MVIGEDTSDATVKTSVTGVASSAKEELPSNESLELMESILQRLQPNDRHEIRDMITNRGWLSGVLLMMAGLFWWISVNKGASSLGDEDLPLSMLGELEFSELALMIPALVFVATTIWSIGRERGLASMSNISGLLVILAIYYILEPIGFALLTDDVDMQSAMVASGRLLALATMIHYSARLFIDAVLLQWVRTQMIHMPVEMIPTMNTSSEEGHADEGIPLA
tara:strand:- start:50012 stop:50680 length:669 start_codon:yes stop_codon:yes gene_type:complete